VIRNAPAAGYLNSNESSSEASFSISVLQQQRSSREKKGEQHSSSILTTY
jgi:hypothetical protein